LIKQQKEILENNHNNVVSELRDRHNKELDNLNQTLQLEKSKYENTIIELKSK